jgi:hypothetical protein
MSWKIFGLPFIGVKIGISENEYVIENSLNSANFRGIYGVFSLVYNPKSKKLYIRDVKHVSTNFKDFLIKIKKSCNSQTLKYFTGVAILGVLLGVIVARFQRSTESWERVFKKLFPSNPISKKDIIEQKRVYCKECSVNPANMMFLNCKHLVYCLNCYKNLKYALKRKMDYCPDCNLFIMNTQKIIYN